MRTPSMRGTARRGAVALASIGALMLGQGAVARALREAGATYCLGLHAKMPPLQDQLPMLRALWPGPLVCRWNLNPVHGPYG